MSEDRYLLAASDWIWQIVTVKCSGTSGKILFWKVKALEVAVFTQQRVGTAQREAMCI